MAVLIEGETYLIDGEKLSFRESQENGELIIFDKVDGSSVAIPLIELIGKDIQEIK